MALPYPSPSPCNPSAYDRARLPEVPILQQPWPSRRHASTLQPIYLSLNTLAVVDNFPLLPFFRVHHLHDVPVRVFGCTWVPRNGNTHRCSLALSSLSSLSLPSSFYWFYCTSFVSRASFIMPTSLSASPTSPPKSDMWRSLLTVFSPSF